MENEEKHSINCSKCICYRTRGKSGCYNQSRRHQFDWRTARHQDGIHRIEILFRLLWELFVKKANGADLNSTYVVRKALNTSTIYVYPKSSFG